MATPADVHWAGQEQIVTPLTIAAQTLALMDSAL